MLPAASRFEARLAVNVSTYSVTATYVGFRSSGRIHVYVRVRDVENVQSVCKLPFPICSMSCLHGRPSDNEMSLQSRETWVARSVCTGIVEVSEVAV